MISFKLAMVAAVSLAIFVAGFLALGAWGDQLATRPIVSYAFIGVWLSSALVLSVIGTMLMVHVLKRLL
jgi:hypothetical protein